LARPAGLRIIFRMLDHDAPLLERLLTDLLGAPRCGGLFKEISVHAPLRAAVGDRVPRAVLAQALNMALFDGLLARVPAARERVNEVVRGGGRVVFDHGALRTVATPFPNALPGGYAAFARILEPLGYRVSNVYPLARISMTGRSFTHEDHPEEIAQFFVSELHLSGFSAGFQSAAQRVLATSRDPLTPAAQERLAILARERALSQADALTLLRDLVPCFGRQHAPPALADYEELLGESAEMAWIATEGHTFNHVTERVADVEAVAEEQKRRGRPMKDAVEVSRSGRIMQTAYFASPVRRALVEADGRPVAREVPGSFYEFIERARIPAADGKGGLDLGFDSGNAQGIFRMTSAA
jgi:hypothetical protein